MNKSFLKIIFILSQKFFLYFIRIFTEIPTRNYGIIWNLTEEESKDFGIIFEGRLVCFYDYECDLGDGWEDSDVHKDSDEKRLQALKMGANIISYIFKN